jgi:hypothetical protein
MTLKVQVPFPGTWVPLQVSLLTLKSPDATTLVTPSAFILGLLKVIVFPALGISTGCSPKLKCLGE